MKQLLTISILFLLSCNKQVQEVAPDEVCKLPMEPNTATPTDNMVRNNILLIWDRVALINTRR